MHKSRQQQQLLSWSEKRLFIKVLPARLGFGVARATASPVIAARALDMRLGSLAPNPSSV
jgi:hypothetical protein